VGQVVSQKRVNDKVGKFSFAFFPSNVYCFSVQMAALFARNHPAQRAVVLPLCFELSRFRGDDAGAGVEVDHSTINRWVRK
jgi:transposase-like protein